QGDVSRSDESEVLSAGQAGSNDLRASSCRLPHGCITFFLVVEQQAVAPAPRSESGAARWRRNRGRMPKCNAAACRGKRRTVSRSTASSPDQWSSPILDDATWEHFIRQTSAVDITNDILASDGPDPIGLDGGHSSAAGHRRVAS